MAVGYFLINLNIFMKYFWFLLFCLCFCTQVAFSNASVALTTLSTTQSAPNPKLKSWKHRLALKIINKKIQKIARKKNNDDALMKKATWALVFSILGLLLISFLVGIIFTIFSARWIRQIKEELFLTNRQLFDFRGATLVDLASAFNLTTLIILGIYVVVFLIAIAFLLVLLS